VRLAKVWTIAGFELRSAVRRPAYLFLTFGFPLFFALIGGVPAYVQRESITRQRERSALYAAVDLSGLLYLSERATHAPWRAAKTSSPAATGMLTDGSGPPRSRSRESAAR